MNETDSAANESVQWQAARVTGIGVDELWFETVKDGLTQSDAETYARREDDIIAIPESGDMPDDWGDQWLAGDLEPDPYESKEASR